MDNVDLTELGWRVYDALSPWRVCFDFGTCDSADQQLERLSVDVSSLLLERVDFRCICAGLYVTHATHSSSIGSGRRDESCIAHCL
jgi:hypothetical protein